MSAKNPNIGELDALEYLKLEKVLNKNSSWKSLIEVLPPLYSNKELLLSIETEKYRPGLSEARILLQRLASQGVCKSTLTEWVQKANLEEALVCLKEEEPLEIIEEPVPRVEIVEGHALRLVCKARSFPAPHYSWFRKGERDTEELTACQEPELLIPSVKEEDSGIYICQVYKVSDDGSYFCIYSKESLVTVMPHSYKWSSDENTSVKNRCTDSAKVDHVFGLDWLHQRDDKNDSGNAIEIIRQPISAEISQGTTLFLKCVARSPCKLQYQWYCNGREMEGEKSFQLKLEDLFPNHITEEMESVYQCLVYNGFHKILSASASVKFKPVDESVQHFAEEKIALLIANDIYESWDSLTLPAEDVATVARSLKSIGFKILAFRNLKYQEMMNAVHIFCTMLKPNSYGLYYFAGHGFEHCKQTYALPVDSSSEPNFEECLCSEYVLMCMKKRNTALNVIFFDACRTPLPSSQSGKTQASCYPVNLSHTVCFYSTSFLGYSHEDKTDTNGYFVKYLKKYLAEKMKILDIVTKVQEDLKADPKLGNCQEPNLYCGFTEYRSLRDEVKQEEESLFDRLFSWTSKPHPICDDKCYEINGIDSSIVLKFYLHKEVFCNALDVHLCFVVQDHVNLPVIKQTKLELRALNDDIDVKASYVSKDGKYEGFLYSWDVNHLLNLQTVTDKLECELLIRHRDTQQLLGAETFTLSSPRLSQLNRFLSNSSTRCQS